MIYASIDATELNEASALFRNVLAEGTLAWSSQSADGFAANALGPQTYDFWTPTALPATLSVTLGAAVECDACAIIGHTLFTAGATVAVEWWNGSAWITAHSVTPTDDRDLMLIFGAQSSAQWRIRVTGAAVMPSISVAMIGPRFIIPDGVAADYVPLNLALDIDLAPSITVKGQYVGTFVKRTGGATSISLAQQRREWIEDEARPFIAHYNEGAPFVWSSCPDLLPDDMAYCWRSGGVLRASYGAGARWGQMGLEVSAYVG